MFSNLNCATKFFYMFPLPQHHGGVKQVGTPPPCEHDIDCVCSCLDTGVAQPTHGLNLPSNSLSQQQGGMKDSLYRNGLRFFVTFRNKIHLTDCRSSDTLRNTSRTRSESHANNHGWIRTPAYSGWRHGDVDFLVTFIDFQVIEAH